LTDCNLLFSKYPFRLLFPSHFSILSLQTCYFASFNVILSDCPFAFFKKLTPPPPGEGKEYQLMSFRRRWERLLRQQTSITVNRLPAKENKLPFSVCRKQTKVAVFLI
jgi:hypothetical protein